MSYSEPLINQIYRFFLGAGFGAVMAVLYEIFVLLRSIFGGGRKITVVFDVIFSVIFTVLSFCFILVYSEGEARFNIVFAQLMGFYAFRVAFGKRISAPIVKMNEKIRISLRKTFIKKNKN